MVESFPRLMSDRTSRPLSLFLASDQAMEEREKLLLDEILDRFKKLAMADYPISTHNRIWESSSGRVDFFDHPPPILLLTLKKLTNVLEGTVDEIDDMDEELDEFANSPPTTTTPSGNWTMTLTYDI